VTYDRPVLFTDHTAVQFRNKSTGDIAQPAAALYASDEGPGTRVFTYNNLTWTTPPASGNALRYTYGATTEILDDFEGSIPGTLLTARTPGVEIEIGGPWGIVEGGAGAASLKIAADGVSAIGGGSGGFWANTIDGGADGLSAFFKVQFDPGTAGKFGVVLRSKETVALEFDCTYINFTVDASGAITEVFMDDWIQYTAPHYHTVSNPFPLLSMNADVEFFIDDLGDSGIRITNSATDEEVTLLGTLPTPAPTGQYHMGPYAEIPDGDVEKMRFNNFTIIAHPAGNYTDAGGTGMTEAIGMDMVNPL